MSGWSMDGWMEWLEAPEKRRTRAERAFLSARPAAFRTCIGELSLTSTADSMTMYSGYTIQ
jgi:hypothetical protein